MVNTPLKKRRKTHTTSYLKITMTSQTKYILPVLFSTDKSGNRRRWLIKAIGDTIYTEYGRVGGKLIRNKRVCQAVSVGRKNEKSPEEQAKIIADRKWTGKLTSGETIDFDLQNEEEEGPSGGDATAMAERVMKEHRERGGNNRTSSSKIRGTKSMKLKQRNDYMVAIKEDKFLLRPMKASNDKWQTDNDGILPGRIAKYISEEESFWLQPKLDGFRCLATLYEGEVVLSSNGRKQLPWFLDLRKELKELMIKNHLDGLDGELCFSLEYIKNGKNSSFSNISSICSTARSNPHPDENIVQLHVFDLFDRSGKISQSKRFEIRDSLFEGYSGPNLRFVTKVETVKSQKYEDVKKYHEIWVENGLEGAIIRGKGCLYEAGYGQAKRSGFLRKYKVFDDSEYKIIGTELDPGVSTEYFVWKVETESGKVFKVPHNANRKVRKEFYKNRENYIGKLLKVKYQGLSKKDGVPRFPKGLGIRPKWDL